MNFGLYQIQFFFVIIKYFFQLFNLYYLGTTFFTDIVY